MTTHSDHHSHDIDYEAMREVLWISVPLITLAAFVLWLMISRSI